MLPGEVLIYERSDGIVYARYRDPPHNKIPRWIIGGDSDAIKKHEGRLDFEEYLDMVDCAKTNYTLKKQLDKMNLKNSQNFQIQPNYRHQFCNTQ